MSHVLKTIFRQGTGRAKPANAAEEDNDPDWRCVYRGSLCDAFLRQRLFTVSSAE